MHLSSFFNVVQCTVCSTYRFVDNYILGHLQRGLVAAFSLNMDFGPHMQLDQKNVPGTRIIFMIKDLLKMVMDRQENFWGFPFGPPKLCQYHLVIRCGDKGCQNTSFCRKFQEIAAKNPEFRLNHVTEGHFMKLAEDPVPIIVDLNDFFYVQHGIVYKLQALIRNSENQINKFTMSVYGRAMSTFAIRSQFV